MRSLLSLTTVCAALVGVSATERLRRQAVTGLCPDPVQQESGYFDIDTTTNKHYFYWSFESRNVPATDPVLMWLTGGPGCSSLLALATENGPCLVNSDGVTMSYNPYGWNSNATAIWVDQPAGVGFSYGDQAGYDHDEAGVAKDLLRFLQAWFKAHPALQNNPLYIFAESYGGHYAPAISNAVFESNKNPAPGDIVLNLQGVGIGNGLTMPTQQYSSYPTLAYNYTMQKLGTPVITLATYEQMMQSLATCLPMIEACQNNTTQCAPAQGFCNNELIGPYEQTGLNPYNFEIPCEVPGLCYNETPSTLFFNQPATQQALGVTGSPTWETCNYGVNGDFASDWMKNFDQALAPQLDAGIRVLVYSGDLDFIVNWIGGHTWTQAMVWSGQSGFHAAPETNWTSTADGSVLGVARTYKALTFLKVLDAGHMVPLDKPAAALQLLTQFLGNQPLL